MIAYNITDRTITFFAKGRPWAVASGTPGYSPLKDLLIAGPAEGEAEIAFVDRLLPHADGRAAIIAASAGKLVLSEDDRFIYDGIELHNVWTSKILDYRKQGIPHEPVFRALEDLQRNPTKAAIERLPIFLERVGSGFLPDGRFTAFKGVRDDYKDAHTGTFSNHVGAKLAMERSEVDANPDATCSRGLHVGAIGYVKSNYGGANHKLMFVAVWPRDVVAVPTDYHGEKMRVCAYEVLDEVDPAYVDDFLGRNKSHVSGYATTGIAPDLRQHNETLEAAENPDETAPAENDGLTNEERAHKKLYLGVAVGQWVKDFNHDLPFEVIAIDHRDEDDRLVLRDSDGDIVGMSFDDFEEVSETPRLAQQATRNGQIKIENHPFLRDGWFDVIEVDTEFAFRDGDNDHFATINIGDEEFEIKNRYVVEIKHKAIDLSFYASSTPGVPDAGGAGDDEVIDEVEEESEPEDDSEADQDRHDHTYGN